MPTQSQIKSSTQTQEEKLSLPELNCSREITTTIAKLRTKYFKGMEILSDGSRSYVEYRHCPYTQLDPKHLFSCLSIVGVLFKMDNDCSMVILYSDHAMDVATAVIPAFGNIYLYPYVLLLQLLHFVIHDNNKN
ncbi:RNase H domain-containing protein [Trichonephila clavipes]|nr:RNase H domain-containing protein [Trichonephila clavipes]